MACDKEAIGKHEAERVSEPSSQPQCSEGRTRMLCSAWQPTERSEKRGQSFKRLPAPDVPGTTEAERMDNEGRDPRRREAREGRTREEARSEEEAH